MSSQAQYFRKALFNTLTEAEVEAFAEARKDPGYAQAFEEYLGTAEATLKLEEEAAVGQERVLAYRYVEKTTHAGEDLYVEFRMHHDEEFAILIEDARKTVVFYDEDIASDETEEGNGSTTKTPIVLGSTDKAAFDQPSSAKLGEKTVRIRRLQGRRLRWLGAAAAVLMLLSAGWWLSGQEGRTINQLKQVGKTHSPFQDEENNLSGALGEEDAMIDKNILLENTQRLLNNREFEGVSSLLAETVFREGVATSGLDDLLVMELIKKIVANDLTSLELRTTVLKLIDLHEKIWVARFQPEAEPVNINNQMGRLDFERLYVISYSPDNRKEVIMELGALIKSGHLSEEDLTTANSLLEVLQ